MSAPASSHPRRRPARQCDPAETLLDSFQNLSIRKGDTYHPTSNTSKSSFWDPLESRLATPAMPMRSSTSPQSLEDLLLGAGERRLTQLLGRVDKAVAAKSKIALGNALSESEVLPVPTFVVDQAPEQERAPKTRTRHHSHSSDSGIGSSIADSTESISTAKISSRPSEYAAFSSLWESANPAEATDAPSSPDSPSFSSISEAADEERCLSKYAAEQIHKHIVQPILREDALSDFHDLIKTVPTSIDDKDIRTLRDLEKRLIFLAPVSLSIRIHSDCTFTHDYLGAKEHSLSPSKYLRFCERTIRVLHTTVTTLHESDQRARNERPYTQGYFLDLVEQVCLKSPMLGFSPHIDSYSQIRRYASILAATREQQAKGDKPESMDSTK